MVEAIPWLAGGAVAVIAIGIMVGFTAWLRFLDDEDTRDVKHHQGPRSGEQNDISNT